MRVGIPCPLLLVAVLMGWLMTSEQDLQDLQDFAG